MKITHIVAVDKNHCIGKGNALAWDIPTDMQFFRNTTKDAIVLMGRKTFESIGRPLPNRENWVLTSNKEWQHEGVFVAHDLSKAFEEIRHNRLENDEDGVLFIIGGADIYHQTLSVADELIVTHVDTEIQDGDAFYPQIPSNFKLRNSVIKTDEQTGIRLEFATYTR